MYVPSVVLEYLVNIAQAVSFSLPTWQACVGYEEGENWVISKMKSGYPRLFRHYILLNADN
jgi:cystathionine gamma-synthase